VRNRNSREEDYQWNSMDSLSQTSILLLIEILIPCGIEYYKSDLSVS
jgi:hypothetical protein